MVAETAVRRDAVGTAQSQFSALIQSTEWSADRDRVKMRGTGFTLEMHVDAEHVHLSADVPLLGKLLGSPLLAGVRGILEQHFQKRLK